jgi:rRNA biogenesis protein RRP5
MPAPKRKAENAAGAPKKDATADDRSVKRQRKSDVGTNGDAEKPKPKLPFTKSPNAPAKSVFNDGEKSFPRGGASVLTPLEHKQIQIKATQDVLFEAAGGKKKGGDGEFSDADSDVEMENAPKASKKRKSKKDKKGKKEEEEVAIKVESLSYKASQGDAM